MLKISKKESVRKSCRSRCEDCEDEALKLLINVVVNKALGSDYQNQLKDGSWILVY